MSKPFFWWTDITESHPAFAAAHLLATWEIWPGGDSLEFRPDEQLKDAERTGPLAQVPAGLTRGAGAIWLLRHIVPAAGLCPQPKL